MARAFFELTFTDAVIAQQKHNGAEGLYAAQTAAEADRKDSLTDAETVFITARDGFYQASVSETGWPYVQFRGGPKGFVHVLDEATIAYADFRGNRQYLSVGNLSKNDRIALFFMDYANRRRLKLLGRVRIVDKANDSDLMARLNNADYRAHPERAFVISVAGFDWNCPQHITQRFTTEEVETAAAPLRAELARLEAENTALKAALAGAHER